MIKIKFTAEQTQDRKTCAFSIEKYSTFVFLNINKTKKINPSKSKYLHQKYIIIKLLSLIVLCFIPLLAAH